MRIPKELEGWTLDEVLENFDSLLTPETSDLLFQIGQDLTLAGHTHLIGFENPQQRTPRRSMLPLHRWGWWARLSPTQQSEIISAYENFDPENSRFEMDHQ